MNIGEGVAMGFEIKNLGSLFAKLNSMNAAAVKAVEKGMKQGIKYTQAEAKRNCPKNEGNLRNDIETRVEIDGRTVSGIVAVNNDHAVYVEFGTGPKGQANHAGTSPNVSPKYHQGSWWIHEGSGDKEIRRDVAEKYHFFYIDTPEGRFYQSSGQPAQPFLYPAIHATKDRVVRVVSDVAIKELLKAVGK